MRTALHFLQTEVLLGEDVIAVEVSFSVRDCGVMPSRRDVQAVVESARDSVGAERLPELSADAVAQLEREALLSWRDEMEADKYGVEDV